MFFRNIWEESDSVCLGVHHSLSGPSHVLHFVVQHLHEGEAEQIKVLNILIFMHFFLFHKLNRPVIVETEFMCYKKKECVKSIKRAIQSLFTLEYECA